MAESNRNCDNNYSITTQQLAQSIQKSAGSARTFGVSMEKLVGLTTAVGEVSRESGNIIGNSWKTILSRITTMDEAADSLESVGISIRDMNGQVRSAEDILDELGGKWHSLTNEQQQFLGVNIAG